MLTNDAGQQLQCSYALKFKILVHKNAPVWVFVSYLYLDKRYHTSSESCITWVLFSTSANVILYNGSVNKKLILLYFKHNIVCFASPSSTGVFSFWKNQAFERIEWMTHKDIYRHLLAVLVSYLEYHFIKKNSLKR